MVIYRSSTHKEVTTHKNVGNLLLKKMKSYLNYYFIKGLKAMKKALLLITLIFALGILLTACANGEQPVNQQPEAPPTEYLNADVPADELDIPDENDSEAERNEAALLLIDIQNDYFEEGSHALYNPLEALSNAEDILSRFRDEGHLVIHVQHLNNAGAGFFEEGTWGAEIHENLTPLENEILVVKRVVSSFSGTDLEEILRENGINRLVVCGMQTNVCVNSVVREGYNLGFEIVLIEDACAALRPDIHESTINRLRDEYATVIRTSEWVGVRTETMHPLEVCLP